MQGLAICNNNIHYSCGMKSEANQKLKTNWKIYDEQEQLTNLTKMINLSLGHHFMTVSIV